MSESALNWTARRWPIGLAAPAPRRYELKSFYPAILASTRLTSPTPTSFISVVSTTVDRGHYIATYSSELLDQHGPDRSRPDAYFSVTDPKSAHLMFHFPDGRSCVESAPCRATGKSSESRETKRKTPYPTFPAAPPTGFLLPLPRLSRLSSRRSSFRPNESQTSSKPSANDSKTSAPAREDKRGRRTPC